MKRPNPRITAAALLLALTTAVQCGDGGTGPDPSRPAAIAAVTGDAQTGTVGQPLGQPLIVRVTNSQGQGVANLTVGWGVIAGGGTLSASSVITNAQGEASVTWTLGTVAGTNNQTARASVSGISGTATFTGSGTPGPASQLALVSGNAQSGGVGQPLSQSLTVAARDQYGNAVSGTSVAWTVTGGGGSVSASSTTTDAQGHAAVIWTLGTSAGVNNQTATASVTGLAGSPVGFTASGTAGPVSKLTLISGDAQTGGVAVALPQPLIVLAQDQYDNAAGGVTVSWSVTAGGGSLSAASVATDNLGHSSVTWTLGTIAGPQAARATVIGASGSPVMFGATGNPGPAAQIAVASGNNQSDTVGQTLAAPLVVRVTDAHGNKVSGAPVSWAVAGGGGSIVPNGASSDTNGEASAVFTLGTIAGSGAHTATASSTGLAGPPVLFTASATPGPAAILASASGDSQTGTVGAPLGQPLVVIVRDQYGNGVPGIAVQWTATTGGGALAGSPVVTDSTGKSAVVWTLGTTAGSNGAEGAVAGLAGSPVPFSASALAGPPAAIVKISGDAQADTVGATLAVPLVVEVHDAYANVVSGATVTWTVGGGGSVAPGNSTTDTLGRTATVRTLGLVAGTNNNLTTAAAGGVQAVFAATVQPGVATQMVIASGNAQTAPAATALPQVLTARVSDSHGNGVTGIALAWSAVTGSLTNTDVVSGTGGLASAQWTLGLSAGTQTATATATGIAGAPAVSFTATATPNGKIGGTITLSNALLSPPQGVKTAVADGAAAPIQLAPKVRSGGATISSSSSLSNNFAPKQPQFTPDELIIVFRANRLGTPALGSPALAVPGTARAAGQAIRDRLSPREAGGELTTVGVSPGILAAKVRVTDVTRIEDVAQRLRGDPDVATVERNAIVWRNLSGRPIPSERAIAASVVPNDPLYEYQAWHYAMIDAPEAWEITHGSATVLVAIVDDGIRFDHPGVAANLTSDGYDFVSDAAVSVCAGGTVSNSGDGGGYDSDPTIPTSYSTDPVAGCVAGINAEGGHGLHVAGTIGAVGNDGSGATGVNWTVRMRPVRALGTTGSGSIYDIAQGILYAAGLPADNGAGGTVQVASGARIINMSFGSPTPSVTLENAVIAASNAGVLLIAAAGNAGTSTPNYPAAYSQVLSVSAVGPDAVLASYSSYGSTVDITAPGGDMGDGDFTFGVMSTFWDFSAGSPTHQVEQGTSMAAPHVTGVAALVLAQNPSLSAAELRARLISYAVDLGPAGPDNFYGAGLVNARNSLTQTFDYARGLYARLYNAATGGAVATVSAQPDGSYVFIALPDGTYYVYAGQDQAGDQRVGEPGRRWGAHGGSAAPTGVIVNGAGTYPASFTVGFPIELESNGSPGLADALAMGGYLLGTISSPSTDADYSVVRLAQSGQYTFETFAVDGACGWALEEDTILELYDASATLIASNDDINFGGFNLCSRITQSLAAGTYYLRVTGFRGGRYQLQARSGS